jgi:hypothetical protein
VKEAEERERPQNDQAPSGAVQIGLPAFHFWVLLGFLACFLAFFIIPVFLNEGQLMIFFEYLPHMQPIGIDLKQVLTYSQTWAQSHQSPYIGSNLYPPLVSVLFVPLLQLPYTSVYASIMLFSLACFIGLTLWLPLRESGSGRLSPLLMLVFIAGLFSYGLHFELERGQFNLIAMAFCMGSVWTFHRHPRLRWLSYLLFSLAVQLKLYPAIFVFLLVQDWDDWRANLRRFLGLGAFNLALFFILGYRIFVDFVAALWKQIHNPNIWMGNHSIRSFVQMFFVSDEGPQWLKGSWLQSNIIALEIVLIVIVVMLMVLVVLGASQRKWRGLDPYAFLALTLGALLIPSVSHDYTLSILVPPVALFLHAPPFVQRLTVRRRYVFLLLALLFSLTYFSTLFSYTIKPLLLQNNLPALLVMLILTTAFSWMDEKKRLHAIR